jgi:hypothetical protein
MFFGRDLLKARPGDGRVFLNHNRDIGMLANERLVVLDLMQGEEFYQGDPKRAEVSLLAQPTESDRDLQKDAIAIYQVADDLYVHGLYRIDGTHLNEESRAASTVTAAEREQPRQGRPGRTLRPIR